MIDGHALETFIAVAEENSFSRAADRLGIAQSVVSKRIRRLEDQFAARLIDRSVRTEIGLTRIGRLYLPEARRTLAELDRNERTVRNLCRGRVGPLRIGFVFSAAMNGTLTAILALLRRSLPELEFEPRLMETPEQLAELDAGRLDIGLTRPRPSYPVECRARVIHSEPVRLCISDSHGLAKKGRIDVADLAGQRIIIPQFHEKVGLIDVIRDLAGKGGFPTPDILQTKDFVTAACLASAGDGVVLAPASLAHLQLAGVTFRDMADHRGMLDTVLVHHREAPGDAVKLLLDFFHHAFHGDELRTLASAEASHSVTAS